jgi:hypothetical protein
MPDVDKEVAEPDDGSACCSTVCGCITKINPLVKDVGQQRNQCAKCWRMPWLTSILVLGVIFANVLVIKGASESSNAVDAIAQEVVTLAEVGIQKVDEISGDVTDITDKLVEYDRATKLLIANITNVVNTTKHLITDYIVVAGASAERTIDATSELCTKTLAKFKEVKVTVNANQKLFGGEIQAVKTFISSVIDLEALEEISERLQMVADMLAEILKYESMVVNAGKVAAGSIDMVTRSNKTTVIDLRVYFDYVETLKTIVDTMSGVVDSSAAFAYAATLPTTTSRTVELLVELNSGDTLAATTLDAATVQASQFTALFDEILNSITALEVQINTYDGDIYPAMERDVTAKLDKITKFLNDVKTTAASAGEDLVTYFKTPGLIIGCYGIVIAVLVELFAWVARMRRRKNLPGCQWKTIQLVAQNELYVIVYILVDVYVIVSFLLAMVFAIVAGLQVSLLMICSGQEGLCTLVQEDLQNGVQYMVAGIIMNTLMSYHLIGAIQVLTHFLCYNTHSPKSHTKCLNICLCAFDPVFIHRVHGHVSLVAFGTFAATTSRMIKMRMTSTAQVTQVPRTSCRKKATRRWFFRTTDVITG